MLEVVHELKSRVGEFSKVLFWAKKRSGATGSRSRVRLSGADRWMFSSDAYDMKRRAEVMRCHRDALAAITELVSVGLTSSVPLKVQ